MFITKLDVVNRCLATMGMLPLNSIQDSTNPFVTNAVECFQNATISEQAQGWWFNIETVKLQPQEDGRYSCSSDTLALSTNDDFNPAWLTLRGTKLYDTGNAQYYTGTQPVSVRIVRLLDFDDLPYSAKRLVQAAAVRKFQTDYDGDQEKIGEADGEEGTAYAACMADHIRAVKANMIYKGNTAALSVRGRIPYSRQGVWR